MVRSLLALITLGLLVGSGLAREITEQDRHWWAFRPLAEAAPPQLPGDDWSLNVIDHYVLKEMRSAGIMPAPQGEKRTMVRRLYVDLLGMPPTRGEIEAYVIDDSPKAWERLVDRLLGDPRYGEHWGRFWLDLVRYAESDGWNQDAYRPHIWRYRDYVVRAFNEDKPYPEFVREQLAGDEIPGDEPEHITAVGFLRLGIYEYNQRDARGLWDDVLNETTDVVGDVFLGMSMACARCHDHKFDPVSQKDYYKLRAFFEPVVWRDDIVAATAAEKAAHQTLHYVWEQATRDVRHRLAELEAPYRTRKWKSTVAKFPLDIQECFHRPVAERTSFEHQMAYLVSRQFLEEGGGPFKNLSEEDERQHQALKKELATFEHLKPKPLAKVMTATDFTGTLSPTLIPDKSAASPVDPGILAVFSDDPEAAMPLPSIPQTSGRRTALAQWIGAEDNPLTPRVLVNRIWQQHFAKGLVITPNDFGHKGEKPSHPQLLDWLSREFIAQGWSIKAIHRLILTSATWQQSARHPRAEAYRKRDPGESLLWRAPVRRLIAEQIRDAMLLVSGELEDRLGGPSVTENLPRRSLYVKSFRNTNDGFLHSFDMVNGLKSVAERNTTVTPTQALTMINGDYGLKRAQRFAERLLDKRTLDVAVLISDAVHSAWGRAPSESEMASARAFLTDRFTLDGVTDFCHVLFNANEFLYVD